jgi:hypothetical protein
VSKKKAIAKAEPASMFPPLERDADDLPLVGRAASRSAAGLPAEPASESVCVKGRPGKLKAVKVLVLCALPYRCPCGHEGNPRADGVPGTTYLVNCPKCLKELPVEAKEIKVKIL